MAIRADDTVALHTAIRDQVRRGPRPIIVIAGDLRLPESDVRKAIDVMVEAGRLEDYGSANRWGYKMRGSRVLAYGLPGLGNSGADDLDEVEFHQRRRGKASGSGVIAPAPYATGYRWGNV